MVHQDYILAKNPCMLCVCILAIIVINSQCTYCCSMCLQRLATEQKTKEENERREKERLEKAKRDEEDRAERKKVSSRQYRGV